MTIEETRGFVITMYPALDGSYGWAIEPEDGGEFFPDWDERWATTKVFGNAKTALQASAAAGKAFASIIERQITEGLREAFKNERPTVTVKT